MDRSELNSWRSVRFLPCGEVLEGRQLLSGSWPPYISHAALKALLNNPVGNPAVRPNTPVLPYGTVSASATYIDPTARIVNGYAVIVSNPGFIGPYATLDAHGGIMKIGFGSVILDNASIVANPLHAHTAPAPEVEIGNQVVIAYGAQVLGPSTIGDYTSSLPTGIGPGAVIDQATIAAGAYVSALARVGPEVTVPSGFLVLPGKNVTTNAEASNPALGMVVTTTGTAEARQIVSELNQLRSTNLSLAAGYVTLYQGNSATGASPGVDPAVTTVFNGNLAAVEGAGRQPPATGSTAPGVGPTFLSHRQDQVQGLLYGFRARATGRVVFKTRAGQVAHRLGRSNSIRADQGQTPIAAQTINIGSIAQTGFGVTISAPLSATAAGAPAFTIGQNFQADTGAVILGGPGRSIGNDVSIGAGAVVDGSSLGSGTTVGAGAYLLNSPFPAGSNIPAGAIYINGIRMGSVVR